MNRFAILPNEFLDQPVEGYYHTRYVGYQKPGNPDYINELKNTFGSEPLQKLSAAKAHLKNVLQEDLNRFPRDLTVCVVPRSKAQNSYHENQLLFKATVREVVRELGFEDGADYIIRHTDTKTTHLTHSIQASQYAGEGAMPYPGITKDTCHISNQVAGRRILLIDDIYTKGVNVDEDAIQALYDLGAQLVVFYAVGKTG